MKIGRFFIPVIAGLALMGSQAIAMGMYRMNNRVVYDPKLVLEGPNRYRITESSGRILLDFNNLGQQAQVEASQIMNSATPYIPHMIQALKALYRRSCPQQAAPPVVAGAPMYLAPVGELPPAPSQMSPNIYTLAGQTISFANSLPPIQEAAAYIFKNVGSTPQEKLELLGGLKIQEYRPND